MAKLRGADIGHLLVRHVMILGSGTIVSQGLVVVATPILSRLYSPEEFGVYAVYVSVVTVLGVTSALRYELAVPLPSTDSLALKVMGAAISAVIIQAAIIAIIAILIAEQVHSLTGNLGATYLPVLIPTAIVGFGVTQSLNGWAIRHKSYTRMAKAKMFQSTGMILVQAGFGATGLGALGLVIGDLVNRFISIPILLDRTTFQRLVWRPFAHIRNAAYRYRRFPLMSSPSAALNTLSLHLPKLLLAVFYGPATAGLFLMSQKLVGLPIRTVGLAVSQVYQGAASEAIRDDPTSIPHLFNLITRKLLLVGLPIIALIAALAPSLLQHVLGGEWAKAGWYVTILAPVSLAQLVVYPISQSAAILERQLPQLMLDIFRVVAVGLSIFAASLFNFTELGAVTIYALAMLGIYVYSYLFYRSLLLSAATEEPTSL